MLIYDLKNNLNSNGDAAYLLSENYEILFMNKAAEVFTPRASIGDSFTKSLCGRKVPCAECPLLGTLTKNKCTVSENSLCSFAEVSFEVADTDDENYIISYWITSKDKDPIKRIKEINIEKALENCGGSREAFESILNTYYTEGKSKIGVIRNHYDNRDYHNLRIEVHGLKSTSYIVGNDHLGDFAKKLEFACKDIEAGENVNSVENAKALIDSELEILLSEYVDFLSKLAGLYGESFYGTDENNFISSSEANSDKEFDLNCPMPESEESAVNLNLAYNMLIEFELETANELFKAIINKENNNAIKDNINIILKLINDYKYDEASELLKKWLVQ